MLRRSVVVAAALAACTSTGGLTGGGDVDAGADAAAPADSGASDDVAAEQDAAADAPVKTPYRDAVLADSPLAYYRFEETVGAVAANEVAVDGGVAAATYTDVALGRPGALASEPGTHAVEIATGRVAIDDARLAFAGKGAFTLEAWLEPKMIDSAYRRVFSHEQVDEPRSGYLVYLQSTLVGFERWHDGGFDDADFNGTLLLGKWTHLVVTYDGSSMVLYLDAKVVGNSGAEVTGAIPTLATPFAIGADSQYALSNFVGLVDEVAVYDRALPAARVAAHYSAAMEN